MSKLKNELSTTDLTILSKLQQDARLSSTDLAACLNISATPTWRRIKRLEELGIIKGYRAELSPLHLGYGVEAFVTVKVGLHDQRGFQLFEAAIMSNEMIVSCHIVSGSEDYLLRVITTDMESYATFITQQASQLPGVKEIRSAIVLKAIKHFKGLNLKGTSTNPD